jgi:hypothetical protein
VTRGVRQPHGIVRRDSIEIGGGNVAPLGILALVPAAPAHPLTRFELCHLRRDAPFHVFNRFHVGVAEIHREQRGSGRKMHVGIDEARSNRAAAQVNDVRLRAGHRLDLRCGSDGGDLAAGDGHRLGDRVGAIDSDHDAINQHGIGGRLRDRRRDTAQHDRQRQRPDRHATHEQLLSDVRPERRARPESFRRRC